MQYGMLVRAGVPSAAVASGLTATSLLTFAGLLALPLAVPAVLAGTVVPPGLVRVLWLGIGLFVLLGGAGGAVLSRRRRRRRRARHVGLPPVRVLVVPACRRGCGIPARAPLRNPGACASHAIRVMPRARGRPNLGSTVSHFWRQR
jgi:hypothetical protein